MEKEDKEEEEEEEEKKIKEEEQGTRHKFGGQRGGAEVGGETK
jgi:hypothetical protein